MLAYASQDHAGGSAGVCWRMLAYAGVCWRMLTYADVCSYVQAELSLLCDELGAIDAKVRLIYIIVCGH